MIRPATGEDISWLVDLCKEHHPRSHWSALSFDPAKVAERFEDWIDSDRATVLVGEARFVVLGLLEPFFSDETICAEVMLYAPLGGGGELRDAAERWAAEQGARLILMGGEEPDRIEAKARWYRQGGYSPFSRTFMKVI